MNKKQIKYGALLSYATILFNIVSGLVYTPWLIQVVGNDHYALYTLALSIVQVFLLDFGIGSAVTRFISNYFAQGQHEKVNKFLGLVYKTFFAISAVIALAMLLFYFQLGRVYQSLSADDLAVFKRLFMIVAVYSVFSFPFTTFNGILISGEKFIELKFCSLAQKVMDVGMIILMLLMGKGVFAIVFAHAVTNALFIGVKYCIIRRKMRLSADLKYWDWGMAKELCGFSSWYTVMNIARRCIYNIMPTVIAALADSEAVVIFSLASALEGYAFNLTDAINGMFMPHVSRIVNGNNHREALHELMVKVAKYHIYSLGLLVIGFISVGRQFAELWMGEQYWLIYPCAIMLLLPSMIETPQQIARTALVVNNVVKEQAILYIIMAVVNLFLSFILIPPYGVLGAALSVSLSYMVKTIGLNWMYHRSLQVNLRRYFKEAYGKWILCAGVTLAAGLWIGFCWSIGGWAGLILKAVLIAGVYLAVLLFGTLTKEDRQALLSRIRRKL